MPNKPDLKTIREQGLILLDAVSGSRAYGLATPTSDTDYKGVFILPKQHFYGLNYIPQISDETNDIVFYELGRFMELLAKNNPNLIELLATPEKALIFKHPLLEQLQPSLFLSKLCKDTFAGYAMSQIKKARGLNKKILNPMKRERKSILDFCWIIEGQGTLPLIDWLQKKNLEQKECGLVNLSHLRDMYALYHEPGVKFRGIMPNPLANEVRLSSVPKGLKPRAYISFNKDGYQRYCKDYKAYWDWVEKRNNARYQNTLSHGKNYDAKNMMHTFRLLDMAAEIAEFGEIRVWRKDRAYYLAIKNGEFDYEDLIKEAGEKIKKIEILYQNSSLPDVPDVKVIEQKLIEIREAWYH